MTDFVLAGGPACPREERDYYSDLQLCGRVDDAEVIKKQYIQLALEKHPDRGGDKDEFNLISEAYALLADPEKKAKYDSRRVDIPHAAATPGRHDAPPAHLSSTASPASSPSPQHNQEESSLVIEDDTWDNYGLLVDGLLPGGHKPGVTYVCVMKRHESGRLDFKDVKKDKLDLAIEEGFRYIEPSFVSFTDPITGEDTREAPVNETYGPIEKFFPVGIELLKARGIDYKSRIQRSREPKPPEVLPAWAATRPTENGPTEPSD